ncbi:MAG TPA: response regulator [Bauldia sp.]|nr:response regulator [Bauldia sp.]
MIASHSLAPFGPIIVVDDDPAVANSLVFALEVDGYSVRTFANAREMLSAADLPRSGCLVIDYGLPDSDGLTLLDQLRQKGFHQPAILITTNPKPFLVRRAQIQGVRIVEKPLLRNSLGEAIRNAIGMPPN